MRLIRYTALALLTSLACYAFLFVLSLVLFPERGATLDTALAAESLFGTEPKYVVFNLPRLEKSRDQIVFVGASSARDGFRPDMLKSQFASAAIVNFAISSADVQETAQVVQAVYDHVPREDWPRLTFVFGIWYGMFEPDASPWPNGATDLDTEFLRYGIYRRAPSPERRIPISLEPLLEEVFRPLLLISRSFNLHVMPSVLSTQLFLLHLAGIETADFVHNRAAAPFDGDRFTLSQQERISWLTSWRRRLGPPRAAAMAGEMGSLDRMARDISSRGGRLVIMDLPLPDWHRQAVLYDDVYERVLALHVPVLEKLKGVSFHTMRDGFSDDDFYDAAHPRPRATPRWAAQAIGAIGAIGRIRHP